MELISLHIPKTGGTSFQQTLEDVYSSSVAFCYGDVPGHLESYRAVHGHIQVAKFANQYPEAKIITWLRHPVARITSYYNYWKASPKHGNPTHDFFLDNALSLGEFAELPAIRNELYGGYLRGFDLSKFFFVGILEEYERDLNLLANLMGWPVVKIYKRNVGPKKNYASITPEIKTIKKLYANELHLYTTICEINERLVQKMNGR